MTRALLGRTIGGAALATALVVAFLLAWAPAEPSAHFNMSRYTWSKCSDGKAKDFIDPIGIVFYGKKATSARVMRLVEKYVDGMKADPDDTSQRLVTHGRCIKTRRGVDDDCGACNRLHIRLADQGFGGKLHRSRGNYVTVGTPHYDDVDAFGCGETPLPTPKHIIPENGFRDARIKIAAAFRDKGHKVFQKRWGNTRSREQCDGENVDAKGDGIVAYVRVN